MVDIRELDRRAVEVSRQVVSGVTADLLDRPTPCSAWDLRQLLAHMIGQHYGFAAVADGETEDRTVFAPRPLGTDPAADYTASADRVLTAFGADGVLDRPFWLPEIRGGTTLPAPTAIGFHFVDYVVHAWDVAAAIDVPVVFDDEVLDAAVRVAGQVPDGDARRAPGAAFGPGLAAPVAANKLDRVLALLGRSARWPE